MRRTRRPTPRADYGPFLARACGEHRVEGTAKRALQKSHLRLRVAGALFALCFAAVGARLVDVSALKSGFEPFDHNRSGAVAYASKRADIVDRNGVLLATNLPTASLYADPSLVLDPEEAASKLAALLPELSRAELMDKLTRPGRFVWIKRHLTPRQQYEINRLGLPGVAFRGGERRVYPHGSLLAHVLGYTGIDNHGLAGLELALDDTLSVSGPNGPEPLRLSVDLRIQYALRDELSQAVAEFDAVGGAGLVLDVKTGEVLGLVSLPDFDPNLPGAPDGEARFNRVTLGVYEMGSAFKTFTTAMALDSGTVGLMDGYDASRPLKVSRYLIHDDHPKNRWLSVPEILVYSSNIGAAKMALDIGTERQRAYLDRFGMLRPAQIELPEVGMPLAPSPWREINTMTIAFGHGIAVSPLQLANAMAATVDGGILRPATLVKRDTRAPVAGERVIRPEVSEAMRGLLRLVVERGTGRNADAPGYLVGGKTGTAEKASDGRYNRKALLSIFIGVFPMSDPRYVVLAMLDEPHGNASTFGYATAGWTAAPVVRHVVGRIGPLLGVQPVSETEESEGPDLLVKLQGGRSELASF